MKHHKVKIICHNTTIKSITINNEPVKSDFNRLNVLKAIRDDKPELLEQVWDSITKNIVKTREFYWDRTWEDGKDHTREVGMKQYFQRMCLNCRKRRGLHIDKRCPI